MMTYPSNAGGQQDPHGAYAQPTYGAPYGEGTGSPSAAGGPPYQGPPSYPPTYPPTYPPAGAVQPYGAPPAAPPRKRSYRGLWITLAVVVLLLALLGGAGVFAFMRYTAPATASGLFCNNLKAQQYDAAYAQLATSLKTQLSAADFRTGVTALDAAEGRVLGCKQANGANVYNYSLGSSTASAKVILTREKQGNLEGTIRLREENGTWKVESLDTGLLGINLRALMTVYSICEVSKTQNYTAAYALLGTALKTQAGTLQDYIKANTVATTIDGPITACSLVSVGPNNTDTTSTITISVTYAKVGDRTGSMTLAVENGAWKVTQAAESLNGTDLRPLATGLAFCAALTAGKLDDAYALFDADLQKALTIAEFKAAFGGANTAWTCQQPDLATYNVNGTIATYNVVLKVTGTQTGRTQTLAVKLRFFKEGTTWKLDDIIPV